MIKYKFAKNQNEQIVDIADVDKNHRDNYFCIGCGAPLIAKVGNKKQRHFAHKASDGCRVETYLHNAAKKIFYDTYVNCITTNSEYKLGYQVEKQCDLHEDITGKICIDKKGTQFINLVELYPKICIEKKDGGFIPDILLYNDSGQKLYVEFAVTHKCTQEKKNSKNRIIEIEIDDEVDLQMLSKNQLSWTDKNVTFHNFRIKNVKVEYLCNNRNGFYYFYLSSPSQYHFEWDRLKYIPEEAELLDSIHCYPGILFGRKQRVLRKAYDEKRYIGQSCFLCRFYYWSYENEDSICRKSTMKVDDKYAEQCPKYCLS